MMVHWVLHGTIILQPAFQRAYVWDRGKASRLVESLVLQIPIPVIYVAEEAEGIYVGRGWTTASDQFLRLYYGYLSGWEGVPALRACLCSPICGADYLRNCRRPTNGDPHGEPARDHHHPGLPPRGEI